MKSRTVTAEIREITARSAGQVLMVQEPSTRLGKLVGLGAGWRVATGQCGRDERPSSAIIVTGRSTDFLELTHLGSAHVTAASLTMEGSTLYLASVYCPPNSPIGPILVKLDTFIRTCGSRVLICGDFNAWHTAWGSVRTKTKGREVMDFVIRNGLAIANEQGSGPTFRRPQGESTIDLTLASVSMRPWIESWGSRFSTNSDHALISFAVRSPSPAAPRRPERFSMKHADWESFRRRIDAAGLASAIENPALTLDEKAEAVTKTIIRAAETALPRSTTGRRGVPWWSPELTRARLGVAKARRACLTSRDCVNGPLKREVYRVLRNSYKRKIEQAKRESWRTFVEESTEGGPWGIAYKVAKGDIGAAIADAAIPVEDLFPSDCEGNRTNLLKLFFPADDEGSDNLYHKTTRRGCRLPPGTDHRAQWDATDLEIAVNGQNRRGSPGHDNISALMIKHALPSIKDSLLGLLNQCLDRGRFPDLWKVAEVKVIPKKGPRPRQSAGSYRPISLLPVLGKVFERMIAWSLREEIGDRFNRRQYGGIKGGSTEAAIRRLRDDVAESPYRYVNILCFDIVAAFDRAWWPGILRRLQEWEISGNLFCILANYLHGRKAVMYVGAKMLVRLIERGCPQGAVLGPPLWDVQSDDLICELEAEELPPVAFVDDIAVSVGGNSRREVRLRSEAAVRIVEGWSTRNKLEVSKAKSFVIVARGKYDNRHPPRVTMGGQYMDVPEAATYLGVTFAQGLQIAPHIDGLSAKINRVIYLLSRLASDTWGMKFGHTRTIYEAAFLGVTLYACPAWGDLLRAPGVRALQRLQRSVLLRVSQAYRTISTDALHVLTDAPPIDLLLTSRMAARCRTRGWAYPERIPGDLRTRLDEAEDSKRAASEWVDEAWERRWAASTKGQVTRDFFPTITARRGKKFIALDHWNVQLLSGHGNFKEKLNSFNLVVSPLCECGLPESARHVILECVRYDGARLAMYREIRDFAPALHSLVESACNFKAFKTFANSWRATAGGF